MIITNHLTASQTAHIAALEAVCKEYDSLQGNIFLSDDLNFDSEFPCFYLLYNPDNNEELISFLSVFAPSELEAEIYAYTAPAWRRQGCFNTLLEQALHTLYEYGIDDIFFVHEPESADTQAVLAGLGTVYRHSECLMKRSPKTTLPSSDDLCSAEVSCLPEASCSKAEACTCLQLVPAGSSDIPAITRLHAEAFDSDIDASHELICEVFADRHCQARKLVASAHAGANSSADSLPHGNAASDTGSLPRDYAPSDSAEPLGICFYTASPKEISVFGIAVAPARQRKGFASFMLQELLRELSYLYPDVPVTLQVNSTNHAACALYQKLGFTVSVQFDYDYADCGELLGLF